MAHAIDQIALVGKVDGFRVVNETHDRGRLGRYLGGVEKFDAPAAVQGRCVLLDGRLEDFVQATGPDARAVLAVDLIRKFENFWHPLPGHRRHGEHRREAEKFGLLL